MSSRDCIEPGSAASAAVSSERVHRQLVTLIEESVDFVAMADARGRLTYLNRPGRELVRLPSLSAAGGVPVSDLMPEWPKILGGLRIEKQGLARWSGEGCLRTGGGGQVPVLATVLGHYDASGAVAHYSILCHDITQRRDYEQQLERLNRTYAAINECNRLVIHASDEQALLERFCEALVTTGGYRFTWIGVPESGPSCLVRPVAHAGFEAGYLKEVAISWSAATPQGQGPVGCALREGRVATLRSVDDDRFHPWLKPARARGYGSVTALPLDFGDGSCAMLALYAGEHDAFDAEEVSLLEALAQSLAFGVASLRTRTARAAAERELEIRNRAIHASQNAIAITDARSRAHRLVYVNPAFERITGYASEEVLGRSPALLLGEESDKAEFGYIRAALREGREAAAVLRTYRKDGALFWNRLNVSPVRDEAGNVTHFICVMTDVTEQRAYEAQLEYQAKHDALTGLPNRSLLQDRLEQALVYARRHHSKVAVLFLDLDGFKVINDSFAHRVGDELLVAVAERLRNTARAVDTVARHGGDEFALVITELATADQLHPILRRLVEVFDSPFQVEDQRLRTTVSVGVSLFPEDGADSATLLRNADAAMYRAKELGRNQVQFYTAELNERAVNRFQLESALREAIAREQLSLAYQPQINAADGRIVGFEALARWTDPVYGVVSPAQFIPLAEETGLILALGEWVLRQACYQARRWRDAGHASFRVAVNVSARQLAHASLDEQVRSILAETGLPPEALELELTESALMESFDAAVETIERLSDLGVAFSLDDFGTGYSSLSYLKRLRFDTLKIDKSFIDNVTQSPDDAAIALAIIGMGHQLRMQVLAEGVETEAQRAYLEQHGCDVYQGYLFSPPVPAEEAEALLRAGRAVFGRPD